MMRFIAILLCALPTTSWALEIIAPDAALDLFSDHVIDYDDGTRERFAPDGTVTQQYPDGACIDGIVFAQDGGLCFTYEGSPDVAHCWWVEQDTDGLFVSSVTVNCRFEITDIGKTPLTCEMDELIG